MSEEQATYTVITFDKLCEVSPELKMIQADAKVMLAKRGDPRKWEKYESLKRRMQSCAGWFAHPGLPEFVHTEEAYDAAHKAIFGGVI
jgi:hypothetical protein